MYRAMKLGAAAVTIVLATAMLASCSSSGRGSRGVELRVLSNRADLVSGDDAYVEIIGVSAASIATLRVSVEGRDITSAFAVRDDQRVTGLVTGLTRGTNVLTAKSSNGGARITITNYPASGPIFAGPHVEPWICATPSPQPATDVLPATAASGVNTMATDRQCTLGTAFRLFYRTTEQCSLSPRGNAPCFKPYDPSGPMPADIAVVTTDAGVTMKYIVRVERGTLDRGIYDLAVLHDPSATWAPYAPQRGWNRKLVWSFGGGSGTSYRQLAPASTWQLDYALERGYMVGVSALTDNGYNSNHVLAAEFVMMAKEHITESYGEIRRTLGSGCSGGSIMQLQLATLYPGLLDGLTVACTYPDSYTTAMEVSDCVLLGNYFSSPEFAALTRELTPPQLAAKKASIAGHLDDKACPAWVNSFGGTNNPGTYTNPRGQKINNCGLLASQVYDFRKNPAGVRCTIPEFGINIWGAIPETTLPGLRIARRTLDNIGIQYGLSTLENGKLSTEEFVTLNEKIGGSDLDSNFTAARMIADPEALHIAYDAGLVGDPRQWARVPIIDLRGNDNSAIHMNWRAFAVRDRLDRVNGNHDNQVIWRYGPGLIPPEQLVVDSLVTMDQWVDGIQKDESLTPVEQKVVQHKPGDAFDFCFIGSDYKTKVTEASICNDDPVLRYYASPHQVAGGPLAEDILKCTLKPLKRSDYRATFNEAQWVRLTKVFANGVCDWSKPGISQQASTPWRSFAAGPGGKPMSAAPRSKRL
jgi:hypothetical protein